jgi:streptogramin lyase
MCLKEDEQHNIWIGTWSDGLYKFYPDKKIFLHFMPEKSNPNSLTNDVITTIYEDKAGYLWFGTENAGVNILKKNKKFYTISNNSKFKNSLPRVPYLCAIADKENKIWVGTDGGGLQWFYRNDYYNAHPFHFGNDKTVRIFTLIKSKSGNFLVGTENVIYEINPYNQQIINHYRYEENNYNSLGGKNIISLCEDKKGDIYAGTINKGLTVIKPAKHKFIRFMYDKDNKTGLPGNYISSLTCDKKGTIWIGTLNGLCKFNPQTGTFAVFTSRSNTIGNDRINTVYSTDTCLWIGTKGGGIDRYSYINKTFYHYTKKSGLPSDNVKAIIKHKNNLWISTTHNIVKLNLKTNGFTIYNKSDGLQNSMYIKDYGQQELEFSENFARKDALGYLYFGGIAGMYVFNPDSLPQNNYKPSVHIEKFMVNGKEYSLNKKDIVLKPDENHLEFIINVFNFIQPEKNKIAYYLENYDTSWHYTQKNKIAYFNLPAGKYTFKYKGANNDGVWNADTIPLNIEILPVFYKTTWFLALIVLFIAVLIIAFSIHKIYIQKELEKKKEQLKYTGSNLSDELINSINRDMIEILTNRKLYLEPDLSLQKLAKEINTKPNYLSQVINSTFASKIK